MKIPIEFLEFVVCNHKMIDPNKLHNKRRWKELIDAKYKVIYLALNNGNHIAELARYYGFNHSTVIYANKLVQSRIEFEPSYRSEIEILEKKLNVYKPTVGNLSLLESWLQKISKEFNDLGREIVREKNNINNQKIAV